jgi:hypothetical protein
MYGLLHDAVEAGLRRAATDRSPGWEGWQSLADHLAPHRPGKDEAAKLWNLLLEDTQGFRREVLSFLVSSRGREAYAEVSSHRDAEKVWDERLFHRPLAASASAPLQALLQAIDAYERFARLLEDAFEDCLYIMTKHQAKVALSEFAASKAVRKAAQELPSLFPSVVEALTTHGSAGRFDQQFADLALQAAPQDWVATLLEHHRKVQRAKKPNGKAPWYERFDDGSHMIRPAYRRERGALGNESYVHSYRTGSLWSFAVDLGKVT